MYWYNGWDNFNAGGMMIFMFIFWALVIVGTIYLIIWMTDSVRHSNNCCRKNEKDSAMNILEERFARGEIDEKEFEAKRKVLE